MEKKHKRYLKLNLMSLFFIGVSFISITLAWFAYSGLITTRTEINVKAWYIEFNKDGKQVSNDIVISLNDISPGMETVSEKIDIKNLGDTPAEVSYEISSVRILDENIEETDQDNLKDQLSHNYPFHIDMSLSDSYIHAHDGTGEFLIAVSWPFESDNDAADSEWGNKAYQFNQEEIKKANADNNYQARTSLKVEIRLKAAQYIEENDAIDHNYIKGNIVLYDVENNTKCSKISSTCLKTYVIDKENKLSDTSVHLLPDLYETYKLSTADNYNEALNELTSTWNVTTRTLKVDDITQLVSNDILESYIVRPKLSNEVIGYLNYGNRSDKSIEKVINGSGFYRFTNSKYPYLTTTKCYWLDTKYNDTNHFALKKIDDTYSKIYGETKTTECSVVPVIEVAKAKLQ